MQATTVRHEKDLLRHKIRELKKSHSAKELEQMSEEILRRLHSNTHIQSAKTVLLYYSLPDEVCTHQFINTLAETKTVLLPVVIDNEHMQLRHYQTPKDLKVGAYNIMEPTGSLFNDYKKIDVVLIPGMSFDKKNHRLGRGKGYYDRFLEQMPNVYKIGVCFKFQIQPVIPFCEQDVTMDEVVY